MNEKYLEWTSHVLEDPDLTAELESVKGQEDEINDRFYRDLEFGTGGLRGVIGAGTNRMNIYTVRKATQGVADYINQNFKNGSVAISHDSRIKSDLFAKEVARVCAANGVKAYIYPELMPTPMLSFAVRALHCSMGVMITASHNPAKYNGYKAYGPDGCQITNETADAVLANILSVNEFDGVKLTDFDEALKSGMISYIGQDVMESYYENVLKQSIHPEIARESGFKVVYTPLNGTGNKPVREILKRIGIQDVTVVKEQELPDGNFPTCPFPNPEIKQALELGMKYCEETGSDLLLATDPDCDRVGIAVKWHGDYKLLTGNEVGALLLDYVASQRIAMGTMPEKPLAVKTIVTTDLCQKIADKYGVELVNVLTGFKFIGEQIGRMEEKGEEGNYIFGFEESYGYLAGTYVRDKDAVVASMLICEMAAFYSKQGRNLVDVLNELYETYGYYYCTQQSFAFEGEQGMADMKALMNTLRQNPAKEIGGGKVLGFGDYLQSVHTDMLTGEKTEIHLPKSDVLMYELEGGCKAVIRPSGTEPKIKIYYFAVQENEALAREKEKELQTAFTKLLRV
ncbi:MAG TPA: phospho-sugar mutase [Candidatus Merdivicinus excrementipullorum]|uniref:Phosphoglucomutase n=1 Tax=Candidatus Merdivicinus excrementipullorum TaxID=2840867 RepID=A0A9D1K0N6_9FIRM|nr:phospho-sugar mutase [Candidatus Merdivicinus excrementipullorum]